MQVTKVSSQHAKVFLKGVTFRPTRKQASRMSWWIPVSNHRIEKALMEEIIRGAWHGLAPVDFNLAFLPERVATREMYRKLGFERMGTNA